MTDNIRTTATVEEYLEAILNMVSERKAVHAARLAERLHVSAPTVTATLRRMGRDGLVTVNQRKEIELTEKGTKGAINIVRRHRLAERLLTDVLKMPWHEAHEEACLIEHGISDRVTESLYQALGRPETCPHGNPIPVEDAIPPIRGVPLDTVPAGESAVVERISEEATQLPELMKYLGQCDLKPGTRLSVKEVANYAGTMALRIGDKEFLLGAKALSLVWVIPEPAS